MKKGNIRDFLNFLLEIILKEKAICCSVGYMLYEFSLPSGLSVAGMTAQITTLLYVYIKLIYYPFKRQHK